MNNRTTGYEGFDESTIREIVVENKKLIMQLTKSTNDLLEELTRRKAKYCPSCGKAAGEVIFYKSNKRKDGLQVYCKDCLAAKLSPVRRSIIDCVAQYEGPATDQQITSSNLATSVLDKYAEEV